MRGGGGLGPSLAAAETKRAVILSEASSHTSSRKRQDVAMYIDPCPFETKSRN